LVFDGDEHRSMSRYAELQKRSFIAASFGKLFHNTGWKMGYCLAPAVLMAEFRKVHQFLVFSVNSPMQHAIAEYLKDENVYLGLPNFFQQKRDHFRSALLQTKFELLPCAGTYFQSVKYDNISDEKDTDFSLRLTKDFGVASIPTSAFYTRGTDHHVLRFCFAKKQETLDRAIEKLITI
jgi:methionine aminotransferase